MHYVSVTGSIENARITTNSSQVLDVNNNLHMEPMILGNDVHVSGVNPLTENDSQHNGKWSFII